VDQHHARGVRSLRWDLLPARLPRGGGILHAKASLLLWSRRARLILASANLTEDGYRRNHEVFGALDYFDGGDAPLSALDDILAFLREAARHAEPSGAASPAVGRWNAFLSRVVANTRRWGATQSPRFLSKPRVFVVATGPARASAFGTLRAQWPDNRPPAQAFVVSPFFDPPDAPNAPARELWELLKQRGQATVEFNVTAEDVPGEKAVFLHAPKSLLDARPANRSQTETVVQRLKLEDGRPLHAKSLWLQNDSVVLLMMGSSNFTSAGLGIGKVKNLEANLAYAVGRQNKDATAALFDCWLPIEEIPDDLERGWEPREDEGEDCAALLLAVPPPAFGEANLGADESQHLFIEFTFVGTPPTGWSVFVEDEREEFLNEAGWTAQGAPSRLRVPWSRERAPSGFRVSWADADGAAWWAVNVVTGAALPPPAELKDLPLELARKVSASSADSAVEFLKLVDDPLERRKSIIFLTHGAMHRGLTDGWVKLAVIQRALHRRHRTAPLRRALSRCAGQLLRFGWVERHCQDIWERMLFLTATPFQLGHHELCSVLERFEGIAWEAPGAPRCGREGFRQQVHELRERLDASQLSALNLDAAWGLLRAEDLATDGRAFHAGELDDWWNSVGAAASRTPAVERVLAACQRTSERMREAESALRPWVIRHLRERVFNGRPRRERMPGRAIHTDTPEGAENGIEVTGGALLPFLLAARATACAPERRPVFAEGLASSYEAFLHTRKSGDASMDSDDEDKPSSGATDSAGSWYLDRLQDALPLQGAHASAAHPKIAATVARVMDLWRRGEKVVVFCHYVQTGRVLRQVISGMMMEEIHHRGAEKLRCTPDEAAAELERIGQRFFDTDSPVRRACDAQVAATLACYENLKPHTAALQEMSRRYLRTPSFLVRFFPLSETRLDEGAVAGAFAFGDGSGLSLSGLLRSFLEFLEEHCVEEERAQFLYAIRSIQTGAIAGLEVQGMNGEDERQGAAPERLLSNVRLVNGAVKPETRHRLMLTFNSPFFPEVLIASNVLAEGVDLHRFCRHVIHHDLCWNPSTLEQRTGRLDRIGTKVERCGHPIRVYLPYLAETQDEKQYRVVMDRERWFRVVMGEKFKVDARTTETLAQRVPLPATLANRLAFRLDVVG
jgi:hypothetical protein